MLEIQKKASEFLGIPLSQLDEDDGGCSGVSILWHSGLIVHRAE